MHEPTTIFDGIVVGGAVAGVTVMSVWAFAEKPRGRRHRRIDLNHAR